MHSRHGITLALILGATALIFAFGGLFVLQFAKVANGDVAPTIASSSEDVSANIKPPRFLTKIEGSNAIIAEIDAEGNTLRAVYTTSLIDNQADFSLFAVPQSNYTGVIYVQAITDAKTPYLKVYPLNAETGVLGRAIINADYDTYTIPESQDAVVIQKGDIITTYELQEN